MGVCPFCGGELERQVCCPLSLDVEPSGDVLCCKCRSTFCADEFGCWVPIGGPAADLEEEIG